MKGVAIAPLVMMMTESTPWASAVAVSAAVASMAAATSYSLRNPTSMSFNNETTIMNWFINLFYFIFNK